LEGRPNGQPWSWPGTSSIIVIRPEQLAQALDRIHPRDRELLSLSLRRRVPDEALGRVYDCAPSEVARRRARAIERVADELELQRGEDLGAVLQALLDPSTWSAAPMLGEEFTTEGGPRLTAVPRPKDAEGPNGAPLAAVPEPAAAEPPAADPAPEPVLVPAREAQEPEDREAKEPQPPAEPKPEPPAEPKAEAPAEPKAEAPAEPKAEAAPTAEPEPAPAPSEPPAPSGSKGSADAEPVLEMLAARRREAPDPPRRAIPLALFGIGIAALVGAAGIVGATQFGDSNKIIRQAGDGGGTRSFDPQKGGPLAAPFPTDPTTASCYSTATVGKTTQLYEEPGGAKRLKITPQTEWGSERVLGVVNQRGGWLGVQAAELRNGEIGWIKRSDATLNCVDWSIHADLKQRKLYVLHGDRTVRTLRVAIGRPENPTPKGRFSVTDKLKVTGSQSPYGCCVLALSGHQTNLPPYWPGGDRLAIHATDNESSIGKPVSLGCMRAVSSEARWLINTIPLGTPVFIST
jgi:L,D-transpeptidase catalytic domain